MNTPLRELYSIRETPEKKQLRSDYLKTVETWLRSLPQTEEILKGMWTILADNAALFAVQANLSKGEFLQWCAEAFELYSRIIKEAGRDPDAVKQLITDRF